MKNNNLRVRKVKVQVKDKIISYDEYYLVDEFGEEIFNREIEIENDNRLYNTYKKQKNLLTSTEIKEIRKKYGLTQKEYAFIIGVGEITIHRFEKGAIQTEAVDSIMRLSNNPKQKIKTLRKDKLAIMQDQIDDWRTKYCYHTDENGTDVPAEEKEIDLTYVNNELDKWIYAMFLSNDQNKKNLAKRIACVAFHCAMVMHMLAGCPDTNKRNARRQIRELTIYIANYCMERYLYKSSDDKYQQFMQMKQSTMPTASKPSRKPTQAEIEHWYSLHGTLDDNGNEIGYGTIAKELGCSKDEVRNAFKRYEKTLN